MHTESRQGGNSSVFISNVILICSLFQCYFLLHVSPQIMALVVIVLGFLVGIPFQMFIHEDHSIKLPSQKWHKWLNKPQFYLVWYGTLFHRKNITHKHTDYLMQCALFIHWHEGLLYMPSTL